MGILELKEGDRLVRVERELGTRGHVFLCWCRHGRFLLISQRLPSIAKAINQLATADVDKVSWQSLYRLVHEQLKTKNVTKGYRAIAVPVEKAKAEVNKLLSERTFQQIGILTDVPQRWLVRKPVVAVNERS